MGVKVGAAAATTTTACFQLIPHSPSSPSSPQTLPSSSRRPCPSSFQMNLLDRTPSPLTRIHRTRSCDFNLHLHSKPRHPLTTIRRAFSASLDSFSDEDFSGKIQEFASTFQMHDDSDALDSDSDSEFHNNNNNNNDRVDECWASDIIIPASIERKANSLGVPLSLHVIKRKMRWQEGFRDAGESAVKNAFSSMVFIMREIQTHALQMRELLFTQDLQGILGRVQLEMYASFEWLFRKVFSQTPTLMVYVMILLANFTVYSMGNNASMAAAMESVSLVVEVQDEQENKNHHNFDLKFDSLAIKTFLVSSSGGKSTSIGGNNGGGGKIRPAANGAGGEGRFDKSDQLGTIVPDSGPLQLSSSGSTGELTSKEDELNLWNKVVSDASKMQALSRDESLDHETVKRFISPIKVEIESDNYEDYFRTELLYRTLLSQDANNPTLLANYGQFLYLVARDYDSAEGYFKRAIAVEPADAEAYSKYANFLWRVRSDLWAAEETFLEAISAEPTNSYYAANYAHFLWNTGGEDTCFPLDSPDNT